MLQNNQQGGEVSSDTAVAVMGNAPIASKKINKMHLEQYEGWQDFEQIKSAWESLLLECPEKTIFLSWEWLKPWWNAYGNGQRVIALAAYDDSKELVGLALLAFVESRTALGTLQVLQLLGDGTKDSDSLDFHRPRRVRGAVLLCRARLVRAAPQGMGRFGAEYRPRRISRGSRPGR